MNETLERQHDLPITIGPPPRTVRDRAPSSTLATVFGLLLSLGVMLTMAGMSLVHGSLVHIHDQRSNEPRTTDPDEVSRPSGETASRSLGSRVRSAAEPGNAGSSAGRAQVIASRVAKSISVTPLRRSAAPLRPGDDRHLVVRVTAPAAHAYATFNHLVRVSVCVSLRHATLIEPCFVQTVDLQRPIRFRAHYGYQAAESEGVIRASVTVRAAVEGRSKAVVTSTKEPFDIGKVQARPWSQAGAWWRASMTAGTSVVTIVGGVVGILVALRRRRRHRHLSARVAPQ